MVFVKATPESEADVMPTTELLSDMGKFNEELIKAGILIDAAGLQGSAHGKRVRFSGSKRTVIDGPFAETKELVAGYWVWELPSLEDAVAWVKRCPNPHLGESEIEIRPLFDADDFENAPPEVVAQEKTLRAKNERKRTGKKK